MALLELRGVTKYYNTTTPALDDVSFSVNKGEFVSVIGPPGSGKTTLLRCINQTVELTGGKISLDGITVSELGRRDLRKYRARIAMILQPCHLVGRMGVMENVLQGRLGHKSMLAGALGWYTREDKRQALAVVQMLGLAEHVNKRCDQLNGSQKQRVAIARALVQGPDLILGDEPIASLDSAGVQTIMEDLRRICKDSGITLLLSLHQVDAALKYSDRIIGVSRGEILFDSSPGQLTSERIADVYGSDTENLIISMAERKRQAS